MKQGYSKTESVTIVGAGFTGLSIAYELAKLGVRVTVLEAENEVGGLASSFNVNGTQLEKFYHIWFTNDSELMRLIDELGLTDGVTVNRTRASIYYANNFFKLSSPWDLLNFRALSFVDRLRLGRLMWRARGIDRWEQLDDQTAHEWLRDLGGDSVYRVVWQPLLRGKFGEYAEEVSAAWFWNKLKLRSKSRGAGGDERFAYLKGGFARLADALVDKIRELGGRVEVNAPVSEVVPEGRKWRTVIPHEIVMSDKVVATPALPVIAKMVSGWADRKYINSLERIRYLGNVCLVMELDRSLTNCYWLSVNDPSFPFVALIEHTNLQSAATYGGKHIVYLSKYMPPGDPLFESSAEQFRDYAFPHLQRMFPEMRREWIHRCHMWKSSWSQPIVERSYRKLVPGEDGPVEGLHVCSMAQIYPEDRGTNYAIRAGRRLAHRIALSMQERSRSVSSSSPNALANSP